MGKALKAGVIGLGILGKQYIECLHGHPAVEIVAAADVRREACTSIAAQIDVECYTDLREMLRRHALDLVVVATPDPLHREPTLAALEAGVPNIVQEKPLATTWEDACTIYEAAERRNAHLFVNFANRAAPNCFATRYAVQKGLLGRVVYGESRLDDNISVPTQMWGQRTRTWAAGSSTAHFLLSHVVDLLRWYFAPAEVTEVYAIAQREVLGYTPDVYDAYLTFDSGLKVRVKAEWIKHIDELVEWHMCFSGAEGTLIHNKHGGFGTCTGWRANLRADLSPEELLSHQRALLAQGTNVAAMLHRPQASTGQLSAGDGRLCPALESRCAEDGFLTTLVGPFIDAIIEGSLTPHSWRERGPLPTHSDGLKQTQIVTAIINSAETGRVVDLV